MQANGACFCFGSIFSEAGSVKLLSFEISSGLTDKNLIA